MAELPNLGGPVERAVREAMGSADLPPNAHPGLVYERYPRVWAGASGSKAGARAPMKSEDAKGYLESFAAGHSALRDGDTRLQRQLSRVASFADAHRDYELTWRFTTGLGADHALENGFTFDERVGVPWLAGSGVKGLARAAASAMGENCARLLGPPIRRDGRPDACVGGAVFLGAWPTRWPRLEVDILNPHHPEYTAAQGRKPENVVVARLDEDPKPVYFLTVAPGTRFRFYLAGQGGEPLSPADQATIWRWLDLGLELMGAGAKTAAGYGSMTPVG